MSKRKKINHECTSQRHSGAWKKSGGSRKKVEADRSLMSPHKISYGKDPLPISLQQSVIDHLGLEPGTTRVCKTCFREWEKWMGNEHSFSALQKKKNKKPRASAMVGGFDVTKGGASGCGCGGAACSDGARLYLSSSLSNSPCSCQNRSSLSNLA